MANEIIKFLQDPNVNSRIEAQMRSKAPQFVTSLSSLVNSNPTLAQCKPETVINAAFKAAVLNLPIENNLGFAYIIPYRNHGVYEAQFQIGYKGYIQLAQRSGQYRTIGAAIVYEGQLTEEDPLRGNVYNWKDKKSDKIEGYVSLFTLINGFEKSWYMSAKDMEKHAARYSKSYQKDKREHKAESLWTTDFNTMALKTTLRLLLPKYGPMSVEMINAVQSDSAILRDNEKVYVDNDDLTDVGATDKQKQAIIAANMNPDTRKENITASEKVYEVTAARTKANIDKVFGETKDVTPKETVAEKAKRLWGNKGKLQETETSSDDNQASGNPE